ncbi:MAG: hypothetical protein IKY33_01075 [Clostridia bacterium]|nr:hypothetical protein [Clostridia bacterium]
MKRLLCWLLVLLVLCAVGCSPIDETPSTEAPADDNPPVTQPENQSPSAKTENLLLDKNAIANEKLLPRGVTKNHAWINELKDKTLTLYYCTENDSFSYTSGKNKIYESTWLRKIQSEYNINVHAVRKSENSSLAAQRIAFLSGQQLDLMSFTPAQLPFALNMTVDATTLLEDYKTTDFLNQTILTYGNGKRFFSPAGVARNLWYTKQAATSPLSLSENELWDLTAFGNFITERTKIKDTTVSIYGYETHDFTDFLSALGTPVITYDNGYTAAIDSAKSNILSLQTLNSTYRYHYNGQSRENAPSLIDGTLAMRYGQTPFIKTADKYPEIEWAPLPTAARHTGKGVVSACAPVFALPKDGPQNKAALCLALLWTARMADANHDLLRFTYGLSFKNWTKYYHATNSQMQIVHSAGANFTAALRRLMATATFEESEYQTLRQDIHNCCINANARLTDE